MRIQRIEVPPMRSKFLGWENGKHGSREHSSKTRFGESNDESNF